MSWHPGMTLDSMEQDAIRSALKFFSGNRTATANALGISVRTLYDKLVKMGIEKPEVKNETRTTATA